MLAARLFVIACAIAASASLSAAQEHRGGTSGQPYAGLEQRRVKALSEQQIADLEAGRGMTLALPGELNGYPGPAHVLELADDLQLSPEQRQRTDTLYAAMKAETIPLGRRVIAAETTLDELFAHHQVTRESLEAATAGSAMAMGELRAAHLRYHLAMMTVLSPAQVDRYQELRGYRSDGAAAHGAGQGDEPNEP